MRLAHSMYAFLLLPLHCTAEVSVKSYTFSDTPQATHSVANLYEEESYPCSPTATAVAASLESSTQAEGWHGHFAEGYIVADVDGEYSFFISGGSVEFWLSSDETRENAGTAPFISSRLGDTADPNNFRHQYSQIAAVHLISGVHYYFKLLHAGGSAPNTFRVGWTKPGAPLNDVPQETIGGSNLLPFVGSPLCTKPLKRKAIVIGVDGVLSSRRDAVNTPNIDRLKTYPVYCGGHKWGMDQQRTSSMPGWLAMLTGTWANKHGLSDNMHGFDTEVLPNRVFPTLFKKLYQRFPGYKMYSLAAWADFNLALTTDSHDVLMDYTKQNTKDAEIAKQVVSTLDNAAPDFIFSQFDFVDHVGHKFKLGQEYDTALQAADTMVGDIIDAVERRMKREHEDWLIILATDHGRAPDGGHGAQSYDEKLAFLATNKPLHNGHRRFETDIRRRKAFPELSTLPPLTNLHATVLNYLSAWDYQDFATDSIPMVGPLQAPVFVSSRINNKHCQFGWTPIWGLPTPQLEWDQHRALFDCDENPEKFPMVVAKDRVYANVNGKGCVLQAGNKGLPVFNCKGKSTEFVITHNKLVFEGRGNVAESCTLSGSTKGGGMPLGGCDYAALFDCVGGGSELAFATVPATRRQVG